MKDELSHSNTGTEASEGTTTGVTRRAFLAAGGAAATAGIAGCSALDSLVERASDEAVTTKVASPAAFYVGADTLSSSGSVGDKTRLFGSDTADVRYVPPTLQADSRRIDIEGWSTSTTTKAQDYNSSRSNKPSSLWVPDPHDEDDGDGVGTLVRVLDMERALSVHLERATEAVDYQASAEATEALAAFIDATTTVRTELDGCPSDTCTTVRENADGRLGLARNASDAIDAGEWGRATKSLQEARRIVDGDIERIYDDLDSDGDGILDGTEALYEYLDGEPTIGEHFAVSLPDTRVRGGGPALADELTPERVLDYVTGERNAESCGEDDRTVAVHRDLACRDLLSATLEEQEQRSVAAFGTSGGVVVTGASPAADVAGPMARVSGECCEESTCCFDYNTWGEDLPSGDAAVSPTFVVPVAATPPDCPSPMPALLFVRRIRHDDQLLYVGGWLVDDGALYEDAATLLVADGPPVVAGVTRSDIADGGVELENGNDRVVRKKPGRTKYGNITLNTPYDSDAEYLPGGAYQACRGDGELYCWGVQSRETLAGGGGDCDDTDTGVHPSAVVAALDAPMLHLVEAAEASNDVKFKAGAELSKSVN